MSIKVMIGRFGITVHKLSERWIREHWTLASREAAAPPEACVIISAYGQRLLFTTPRFSGVEPACGVCLHDEQKMGRLWHEAGMDAPNYSVENLLRFWWLVNQLRNS